MWFVDFSIRRSAALSCVFIGLVILGVYSYRQMPLELLPKLDVPYITVVTVYPGASPEDLELDVAKRIEDAVLTIEGLKHVTSSCMENVVITLLEFQLGTDVDRAATDVREKIDLIRRDLPEGWKIRRSRSSTSMPHRSLPLHLSVRRESVWMIFTTMPTTNCAIA